MKIATTRMAADCTNDCKLQGFDYFPVAGFEQFCVRTSSVILFICRLDASQSAIYIFNYHRLRVSLMGENHGFSK